MDEAAVSRDMRGRELRLCAPFYKYKQKSVVIPIQTLKIPMYISVMSPLCFSRQSVGFVVGIQWRDSEEQSGWESCCWQNESQKLYFFSISFFGFPIWKHPCSVFFVLNCFLLPESKVRETMKKDPGRRAAEAALIFLPDLTVNWRWC